MNSTNVTNSTHQISDLAKIIHQVQDEITCLEELIEHHVGLVMIIFVLIKCFICLLCMKLLKKRRTAKQFERDHSLLNLGDLDELNKLQQVDGDTDTISRSTAMLIDEESTDLCGSYGQLLP